MTDNLISNFAKSILHGFSQIMLQKNPITGALFIAGIAVNAPILAASGLLGAALAMAVAYVLKYDRQHIYDGLYGYNGALVGVALPFFYPPSLALFLIMAIAAAGTAPLTKLMMQRLRLPAYTAPFVVATWAALFICRITGFVMLPVAGPQHTILEALPHSFGQIIFQENLITGVMFMIAIAVSSRWQFLWGCIGGLVGILAAMLVGRPESAVYAGIFGYNSVLCGIALSENRNRFFGKALLSALLAVILLMAFQSVSITALTAPFVISCWLVLISEKFLKQHTGKLNSGL